MMKYTKKETGMTFPLRVQFVTLFKKLIKTIRLLEIYLLTSAISNFASGFLGLFQLHAH